MPSAPIDASQSAIANLSPDLQRAYYTSAAAEKKNLQVVVDRKESNDKRMELLTDVLGKVDSVKALLPNLNSYNAIRELALRSADEKVASGTIDKRVAEPGSHSLEVMQLASCASAVSNAFPDRDSTTVGSGFFTFETANGETKEIFIDSDNATLDNLARLINGSRMGVRASVVNDVTDPDLPYRLVLSADGVGTGKNVEYPEFYLVDGQNEFYIESERPASNALIKYQGMDLEVPDNSITDLIRGVTLNLKGISDPGRPVSINIDQDVPKTTAKFKELVEKLNQVFTFIQGQNSMDEHTKNDKPLGGDYGIRMAEQRLRSALGINSLTDQTKLIKSMADIGIGFTKKGTLSIDDKKLENAINGHFDETVDLLLGDGIRKGVFTALETALNSISSPDGTSGVLSNQKKTALEQSMKLQKDLETKEKAANQRQEALKIKLASANAAIARLQQQAGYLNSNMGGGAEASMVQKLIG